MNRLFRCAALAAVSAVGARAGAAALCRGAVAARLSLDAADGLRLVFDAPQPWFLGAFLLAALLLSAGLRGRELALASVCASAAACAQLAALALAIQSRGDPLSPDGIFSLAATPSPVECRGGRCLEEKTNALGFRGPALRAGRGAGPRVALLGDSYVFGSGVDEGDTLDARLRQALLRADPRAPWEVGSFAVPGFNFHSDVRMLKAVAPRFRPDYVVVGFLRGNDLVPADPWAHRDALGPFLWKASSYFGVEAPLLDLQLRRCDARRLSAPDITGAFARDLGELRALAENSATRVFIFSYFGPEPLIDENRLGRDVRLMWPKLGWQGEPGLAIPGDGHPTGRANELFAATLSEILVSSRRQRPPRAKA